MPEHFDQVTPSAATRVKHYDIGICQAIGEIKFLAQHGIDASDLVLNDLRRGIPDAQILPQLRIERFQEWLIEVLDGVRFLELLKEGGSLHSVEHPGSPVKHLHQPQWTKLAGRSNFFV